MNIAEILNDVGLADMAKARCEKKTLTQSENLKTGQRGIYEIQGPKTKAVAQSLKCTCWVEKQKSKITEADKNLLHFIDIPCGYKLVYGITFQGKDYECGDMPRDIGRVLFGISIATETNSDPSKIGAMGSGELHYCPKCKVGVYSCQHNTLPVA